jgi:peptidyl-prolyl cis-trans isomerase SurA
VKRWLAAALLFGAVMALAHHAEAVVVERVVAVVGEKAILLSDLRKRARPFLVRLYTQVPAGPQRAAAESKVFSQLVERMVDDELELVAASRNNTRVTADEIDKALQRVAGASGMPLAKLFEEVERTTGMTEVEYRQDIRRQVLEGKLLNRFIQNARVTEFEVEEMFDRVQKQERGLLLYNPAWIVLRLGKAPTKAVIAEKKALAAQIVQQLKSGSDFATLAHEHSEDEDSKAAGGDLGIRVPSSSPRALEGKYRMLNRDLEVRIVQLDIAEVSEPFVYKDALVIMTIVSRQPSRYTALNPVAGEMMERVRSEKLQKVKEKWLRDLRRRTFVDVRL